MSCQDANSTYKTLSRYFSHYSELNVFSQRVKDSLHFSDDYYYNEKLDTGYLVLCSMFYDFLFVVNSILEGDNYDKSDLWDFQMEKINIKTRKTVRIIQQLMAGNITKKNPIIIGTLIESKDSEGVSEKLGLYSVYKIPWKYFTKI